MSSVDQADGEAEIADYLASDDFQRLYKYQQKYARAILVGLNRVSEEFWAVPVAKMLPWQLEQAGCNYSPEPSSKALIKAFPGVVDSFLKYVLGPSEQLDAISGMLAADHAISFSLISAHDEVFKNLYELGVEPNAVDKDVRASYLESWLTMIKVDPLFSEKFPGQHAAAASAQVQAFFERVAKNNLDMPFRAGQKILTKSMLQLYPRKRSDALTGFAWTLFRFFYMIGCSFNIELRAWAEFLDRFEQALVAATKNDQLWSQFSEKLGAGLAAGSTKYGRTVDERLTGDIAGDDDSAELPEDFDGEMQASLLKMLAAGDDDGTERPAIIDREMDAFLEAHHLSAERPAELDNWLWAHPQRSDVQLFIALHTEYFYWETTSLVQEFCASTEFAQLDRIAQATAAPLIMKIYMFMRNNFQIELVVTDPVSWSYVLKIGLIFADLDPFETPYFETIFNQFFEFMGKDEGMENVPQLQAITERDWPLTEARISNLKLAPLYRRLSNVVTEKMPITDPAAEKAFRDLFMKELVGSSDQSASNKSDGGTANDHDSRASSDHGKLINFKKSRSRKK